MEIQIRRSRRQVVLVLHGVDGVLRWRDFAIGGSLPSAGATLDDPAMITIEMPR